MMKTKNIQDFQDDQLDDGLFLNKIKDKKKKSRLLAEALYKSDLTPQEKNQRDVTPILVPEAKLPIKFWETGWVFKAIDDMDWRVLTNNVFPATLRKDHKTHPGYIFREIGDYALMLCPLSSIGWKKFKFIPEGAVLEITKIKMDKKSYVIDRASSLLPRYNRLFYSNPKFLGIYPPEKLES